MEKVSVVIKEIKWMDEEILEGDVMFEINGQQLRAFSHPCKFIPGEIAMADFHFLDDDIPENLFWCGNTSQQKSINSNKR